MAPRRTNSRWCCWTCKMPDMDGFETATLIRQRDKSRHTPIIFLTAADRARAGRPRVRGRRGGLPGQAGRAGVRPLEGGRLRGARQEDRAAPPPGRAAAGERAGRARAGRDPRRAGAGPGAQEPGARELQLRRLARPPGPPPPDRELQPRGARRARRSAGRRRPPTTSTACARRASRCPSSSTTCCTWPASRGPRCGSRKWI